MNKKHVLMSTVAAAAVMSAAVISVQTTLAADEPPAPMTFFVTNTSQTGNLGGLAGADAICQRLAQAAGSPANRTWRAYLSTQGPGAVNARDRIGTGPWHNANGVRIAANVADLHGDDERDRNYIIAETALDESGDTILGRIGRPEGTRNEHDIITGSDSHGMALTDGMDGTCMNWTSASDDARAMVGHHDRSGGNTTSWNSAHRSPGCSVAGLQRSGGAGHFYCFATN